MTLIIKVGSGANAQPVLHPGEAIKSSLRLATPIDYWQRANSYTCPLGMEPGSAWLLMRRSNLAALSANAWHPLQWFDATNRFTLYISKLAIVRSITMNTATATDGNAAVLVEMQDKRRVLKTSSINKQYNVRHPAPSGGSSITQPYYAASLNTSTAWTWQEMVDDIWDELPSIAGTAPTLPYTPDGTPEGFRFIGLSAWDALGEVLAKLNCTIALNPLTDELRIVRQGVGSSGFDSTLAEYRNRLLYDYAPGTGYELANMPETIRVWFMRREIYHGIEKDSPDANNWEMDPVASRDYSTGATGAIADSVLNVWDDLPALTDASGLTNGTDLTTRADEIGANWKAEIDTDNARFRRMYSGLLGNSVILPGGDVDAIVWRDYGDDTGLVTEIIRTPEEPPGKAAGGFEKFRTPDFTRNTHPLYPRVSQPVLVDDGTSESEAELTANAGGYYPGYVQRWVGSWDNLEACWIKKADVKASTKVLQGDRFIGRLSGVATVGSLTLPVYIVRVGTTTTSGAGTMEFYLDSDEGSTATITDGDTIDFDASDRSWTSEANSSQAERGIVQRVDGGATTSKISTAIDKSVMQNIALNGSATAGGPVLGRDGTRNSVQFTAVDSASGSPIVLTGAAGDITVTANNEFHTINGDSSGSGGSVALDFRDTLEIVSPAGAVTAGKIGDVVTVTLPAGSYVFNASADEGTTDTLTTGDTLDFDASGLTWSTEANGTASKRGIVQQVENVSATVTRIKTAVDKSVLQEVELTGTATAGTDPVLISAGTRNSLEIEAVDSAAGSPVIVTGGTGKITLTANNEFGTINGGSSGADGSEDFDFRDTIEFTSTSGAVNVSKVGDVISVEIDGSGLPVGAIVMGYKATVTDGGKQYMDDGSGSADTRWALMDGASNSSPGSGIAMVDGSDTHFVRAKSGTGAASGTPAGRVSPVAIEDEVTVAIDDHPDHYHYITPDCGHAHVVGSETHFDFPSSSAVLTTKQKSVAGADIDLVHDLSLTNHQGTSSSKIKVTPPNIALHFFERVQ